MNNKLSSSANNALRRFASSVGAGIPVQVESKCTLILQLRQLIVRKLQVYVLLLGSISKKFHVHGKLCNPEVERSDQHKTCIEISESSGTDGWKTRIIGFLFMSIFHYIGLGVACPYSATEDTYKGVLQITVEGPSPVGVRNLVGNYFFSADNTHVPHGKGVHYARLYLALTGFGSCNFC